jgi:hypothetical protein
MEGRGNSSDVSSAQSIRVASALGVRSSSPAAGQGEGSGWGESVGRLGVEDSTNWAIIAADSAAVGHLTASEAAFVAVIICGGGPAHLGSLAVSVDESFSRPT